METEKSSPSALPSPDPETVGLPGSSPCSQQCVSRTCSCRTIFCLAEPSLLPDQSVCHAAGPEEPQPLQQCLHTAKHHLSMVLVATEAMLPLFLSLGEQVQQHPPRSPWGTRASQHHETPGRKRPHTVRIIFSPTAASCSLTLELGMAWPPPHWGPGLAQLGFPG